ncbi:hypothetical protein M407DRAFT_244768 [Tulasnella calospora MUT 4182]|uniref:Uncharacterized protein n=1 Tax=Tulasnella calospora MUT 4182 TaxID=1051891 RepID=A0A0C3QEK9_9AGAM|nr:hypothetical protein M407DRAFT_244768 [Tulasnella calospora MUT 4182]
MPRNFAALVLLSSAFLPQALARYCYYDRYGYRRCSGLSPGARAGIAIAIIIGGACLVLLCVAIWLRRRRVQRANKAFIVHDAKQPYQPGFYQSDQPVSRQPHGSYMNQQPGNPQTQYPAAVHTPTGYPTRPGMYVPPPGSPPPAGNVFGKPPSYPERPGRNTQFGNQANV